MIYSKKANIPVTILVLSVLAVCFLTLLSFYASEQKIQNSFSSISLVQFTNLISDKLLFYSFLIKLGYFDESYVLNSFSSISSPKKDIGLQVSTVSFSVEKDQDKYIIKGKYIKHHRLLFFLEDKEVLSIQYPHIP